MQQNEALRVKDWSRNFETHESRKCKRLEWIAVPNDLSDIRYRMLLDHPNGTAHFGAWIAIVEVASTCKPRGVLADGGVALSAKHLSFKTGIPEGVLAEAIPRLLELGWLDESSDLPGDSPEVPGDSPEVPGKSSTYTNRDTNRNKNTSNRTDALLTSENIEYVRQELGTHRRMGKLPDEKITRKILAAFKGMDDFKAWFADIRKNLNPGSITGKGFGVYLADAEHWAMSEQRRSAARATVAPKPFDPRTITGEQS
jgi:hypothetical protein